jgi:hypothetical protein
MSDPTGVINQLRRDRRPDSVRPRVVRVAAVAGTLALAGLVVGCSDSPVGGPEDVASDGGGSVEAFCADYQALDERFANPEVPPSNAEIAEALGEIDAPEEIADDFEAFTVGFSEAGELDPNDPANAERVAEIQAAGNSVSGYIADECETPGGEGEDVPQG